MQYRKFPLLRMGFMTVIFLVSKTYSRLHSILGLRWNFTLLKYHFRMLMLKTNFLANVTRALVYNTHIYIQIVQRQREYVKFAVRKCHIILEPLQSRFLYHAFSQNVQMHPPRLQCIQSILKYLDNQLVIAHLATDNAYFLGLE